MNLRNLVFAEGLKYPDAVYGTDCRFHLKEEVMRKFLILGLVSMFFAATSIACNKSEETPAPEASASAAAEAETPAPAMAASPAASEMASPAASPAGS